MISGGEILNVTYAGKFTVIKDAHGGEKSDYYFDQIAGAIADTDTVWSNVTRWLEINWRETFDGEPKVFRTVLSQFPPLKRSRSAPTKST